MASYTNQEFTNFRAVNLRGSANIRFAVDAAAGTLRAELSEGVDRAYVLPNKSGTFPIAGTFAVQLPAVTSFGETAVTISGIRREDGFIAQIKEMGSTVTTGRTFPFIVGARPENGYVYLTFYNPTGTATLYSELVVAYAAWR